MLWLSICAIFCTTLLGILFKEAGDRKLNLYNVVKINYSTCILLGLLHTDRQLHADTLADLLKHAIPLGVLFYAGFSSFAYSVKFCGLPLSTSYQKLSIALSVPYLACSGIPLNLIQIAGFTSALLAIYAFHKAKSNSTINTIQQRLLLWSCLIISAIIEVGFANYNAHSKQVHSSSIMLATLVFLFALSTGMIHSAIYPKTTYTKSLKAEIGYGILLGIPNYYSIYSLIGALHSEIAPERFYPILNCSVILLSVLVARSIYHEKLNRNQLLGIILSLVAVILLHL